jgi:hypothetical protein
MAMRLPRIRFSSGGQRQQILAVVQRLAGGAAVARQQAHHGQHGLALARAAFAHDAQRLPAIQRKTDAVDGIHQAVLGLELHAEVFDFK